MLSCGQDFRVCRRWIEESKKLAVGTGGDEASACGETAIGTIDAGGKVRNAKRVTWRAEDGSGGSHSVEEGKDFELGFKFVGDEIEDDISQTDGILNGGGEAKSAWAGAAGHIGKVCLGLAEIGGHDVFEDDVKADASRCKGKAAARDASPDDSDVLNLRRLVIRGWRFCDGAIHLAPVTAVMTDS